MKLKTYILLSGFCLFFFGTMHSQTRSEKRGLAYDFPVSEDVEAIYKGVSWFYNWAYLPAQDEGIPETIEQCEIMYIPMAWNGGIQIEKLREYYKNNPQVKYLLGFNEPNFTEQANMTPTEAAAKWPILEEIAREFGLKIIGPAVNYGPTDGTVSENGVLYTDPVKYLDDFLTACPDCQVDYIAIHCYMSHLSALKSFVERFRKYDKPIWLTEFCAWDEGTNEISQRKYMAEAVNYLETEPIIYKYSWFIGRWKEAFPYMQVYSRKPGELTDVGEVYVNMSSFDKDYYFSVNDTIEAEHYIEVSEGVHLEKTTDVSGKINIMDFIMNRKVSYNLDVTESGEYEILYRIATNSETSKLIFSVNGNVLVTQELEDTKNSWKTVSFKTQLQKGKQQIQIESGHTNVSLNWLKVSDEGISSINSEHGKSMKIFPNPTNDKINIESDIESNVSLYDLAGIKLLQGNSSQPISLNNFSAGLYLLKLEFQNGETFTQKVMKID